MPAFDTGSGALALASDRPSEPDPSQGKPVGASLSRWLGRRGTLAVVFFAALMMVVGAPLVSASSTSAGLIASGSPAMPVLPLVSLAGTDGSIPASAVALGPVSPSAYVEFDVEVNIVQDAQEQVFMNDLGTQGSPLYHHYVSGQEFVQMFGPSPGQRAALLQYFRGYGITVVPADQLGLLYTLDGTAAQVNAALHTTLTTYRSGSSITSAPAVVPSVPTAIAPWVESFAALNGFDLAHPDDVVAAGPHPLTAVTPSELEGAYDATPLLTGGDTGNKLTIGLAEMCDPDQASTTYQTDVNSFDSANSLPAITITLSDDTGSCASGSPGWGLETDLDIQSSHSMATGAALNVCLDNLDPATCDSNFVTAGIPIGSNSWGGGGPYTSIWNAAAAAGVTLLASAGDSCATSPPNDPALEPEGIGVGGTSLTVSGTTWSSEVVWDTSCTTVGGGGEGTGGGCDASVAPPAWQIGMTGYPGACSTTTTRGVPDVAADADPNTGLDIVSSEPEYCSPAPCTIQVGGTSLACPLWAAGLALIFQDSGWTGFFGPEVYTLSKSASYSTYYHDITSGTNGYSATTGWDPATGVGSPILAVIATGVISPLVVAFTASATTIEAGTSVTFTATVSGGSTPYTYSWLYNTSGGPSVIPGSPDAPIFTWTPLHAGTYHINLTVVDNAGAKASAGPVVLIVTPGPQILSFTATPLNVEAGQKVTLTVSAAGGTPPYFYVWTLNGTPLKNPAPSDSATAVWTAPDQTATYALGVVVSDQVGGAGVASLDVNVYQRIAASLQIHPLGAIDSGTNVTFVANSIGGDGPIQYTLWQNQTALAFSSTTALTSVRFPWTPWRAGTYSFDLETVDALGFKAWSLNDTIVVNSNLSVTLPTPTPSTVDVGAFVTFNAIAEGGTGPLSYTWTVDGVVDPSDTSASFSEAATSVGTVSASVSVTDAHFRQASAPAVTVNVNPDPLVSIEGPSSLAPSVNGQYTAAVSGGTAPYTYLWSVNETPNTGSQSTYSFSASHGGQFVIAVVVVDATGATVHAYKAVSVSPSDVGFIPGTTPLESYAVIFGAVVAIVGLVLALLIARKRRKPKEGPSGPPPMPAAATWAPAGALPGATAAATASGFCGSCGTPKVAGASACASCGTPYGGAPLPPGGAPALPPGGPSPPPT